MPTIKVTPQLRFRFYMRGWRAGASGADSPVPENFPHELQGEYQAGLCSGRNARRSTMRGACRRLQIKPTDLGPDTGEDDASEA